MTPGGIGCARWAAVLADPFLRPMRRLDLRGGTVNFESSKPGTAEVSYRRACTDGDVYEGWHHLCLYRSNRPWRPLYAGPVTAADTEAGEIESEDLSSILSTRVGHGQAFMAERAADPMTWMGRLLDEANRVGRIPIVLAPHGPFGDVQATIGASPGDTLDDVLDTLSNLGVVWAMQGPVLRFGINWSAPDGGLLTHRDFHRFRFRVAGGVTTEVHARSDGAHGMWPPNPRRTPPVGVTVIDGGGVTSSPGLDRLARIHYERVAGRSVTVDGARLRRGLPLDVREFVPGRRFIIAGPDRNLRAVVTACQVTIGGGGSETEVTVNLDKAAPARPRRAA